MKTLGILLTLALRVINFSDPVVTNLEDRLVTVKMEMQGLGDMKMRFLYTDRKISNRESKILTAATFEYIFADQALKMKTILEMTMTSKERFADGI